MSSERARNVPVFCVRTPLGRGCGSVPGSDVARHEHGLRLEERLEPFGAPLPTDAGALATSKWNRRRDLEPVDAQMTGMNPRRDLESPFGIGAVDATAQSQVGIIRHCYGLID